jgi:hypothetical protein
MIANRAWPATLWAGEMLMVVADIDMRSLACYVHVNLADEPGRLEVE